MTEVALLEAVGGELLRGAEPALVSDHRLEVCFARLDNPPRPVRSRNSVAGPAAWAHATGVPCGRLEVPRAD